MGFKGTDLIAPAILGAGVMILTPLVAGIMPADIAFLTTVVVEGVTVATLISAGIVAFGLDWVVTQYIK